MRSRPAKLRGWEVVIGGEMRGEGCGVEGWEGGGDLENEKGSVADS